MSNEGYIIVAIGDKYVLEAKNFFKTLRGIGKDKRDVSIVTNGDSNVDISEFNEIIVPKNNLDKYCRSEFENKCIIPKLIINTLSPYQKTILIDSDVLCIYDTSSAWNLLEGKIFCGIGKEKDPQWHWGFIEDVKRISGIPNIPHFHGGFVYFEKDDSEKVFQDAINAYINYDKLGCKRMFRGSPTEEMMFAMACAKNNILPLEFGKQNIMNFIFYDTQIPTKRCDLFGFSDNYYIFSHMYHSKKSQVYKNIIDQCGGKT